MEFPPPSLVFLPESHGTPAKTCVDAGGADRYSGWRCMLLALRCLEKEEGIVTALGLPRDHYELMDLVRAGRTQTGDATDEEVRVFSALVGSRLAREGTASIFDSLSFERVRARRNAAAAAEPPSRRAISVSEGDQNMRIVQTVFLTSMNTYFEERPPASDLPILLQEQFRVVHGRVDEFLDFATRRRKLARDWQA